jgi:hypothetical protein
MSEMMMTIANAWMLGLMDGEVYGATLWIARMWFLGLGVARE